MTEEDPPLIALDHLTADPTCTCWRRLADYVRDDLLRHEGDLERRTEMKEKHD